MSDRVGSSQQAIKIFLQIYFSKISYLIFSASLAENWGRKNMAMVFQEQFRQIQNNMIFRFLTSGVFAVANDYEERKLRRRSIIFASPE